MQTRRRKPEKELDSVSRKKRKRRSGGRTNEIEDQRLWNRRDALVQILEGAWGEIGWELSCVKKAQEIPQALKPLDTGVREQALEPFLRVSDAPDDMTRIRKLRRDLKKSRKPLYRAYEAQQKADEVLARVKAAFPDPSLLSRQQEAEYLKRELNAKHARDRYDQAQRENRAREVELESLEAAYAQSQLIRFLDEGRYALAPLQVAEAMAGLPYVSYRWSIELCQEQPCIIAGGLWYQVFLLVERAVKRMPSGDAEAIIATLRAAIPVLKVPVYIKNHVAENCFFLQRAVRQDCANRQAKPLPFRITASFSRQCHSQSREDAAQAELGKLSLRSATARGAAT